MEVINYLGTLNSRENGLSYEKGQIELCATLFNLNVDKIFDYKPYDDTKISF